MSGLPRISRPAIIVRDWHSETSYPREVATPWLSPEYREAIILLDRETWGGYNWTMNYVLGRYGDQQNGRALMNSAARYLNYRDAAGVRRAGLPQTTAACRQTPLRPARLRALQFGGRRMPTYPRFYQTKPFVMCENAAGKLCV